MDLFPPDAERNLLPCDGVLRYAGPVLSPSEADEVFQTLLGEIAWRQDEVVMFGRSIVTSRKVAWYAASGQAYTYSGTTRQALPFTETLLQLKSLTESRTGAVFNACLLNLYHHGGEGMGWHADDEPSIEPQSCIAAISLGAERRFMLKHRTQPLKTAVLLEHGSLMTMEGAIQRHWLHSIPKSTRITAPRISLTWRLMRPQVSR